MIKIEFSIKGSQFKLGAGTAEIVRDINAYSRPQDVFDCQLMDGTFSNRNGQNFSTPHLRYNAFPLIDGLTFSVTGQSDFSGLRKLVYSLIRIPPN